MWGAVVAIGFIWWMLSGKDTTDEEGDTPTPTPPVIPYAKFRSVGEIDCSRTECEGVGDNPDWNTEVIKYQPSADDELIYVILGNSSFTGFIRSSSDYGTVDLTGADGSEQENVQVFSGTGDAGTKMQELYTRWLENNVEPETPETPPVAPPAPPILPVGGDMVESAPPTTTDKPDNTGSGFQPPPNFGNRGKVGTGVKLNGGRLNG
jgi:hypothetical protein